MAHWPLPLLWQRPVFHNRWQVQHAQRLHEQAAGARADLKEQELGPGGRPLAVAVALVGRADADLHAVRQHVGVDVRQLEEVVPADQVRDSSCAFTAVPANAGVRRGLGDQTGLRQGVLHAAGNAHSILACSLDTGTPYSRCMASLAQSSPKNPCAEAERHQTWPGSLLALVACKEQCDVWNSVCHVQMCGFFRLPILRAAFHQHSILYCPFLE